MSKGTDHPYLSRRQWCRSRGRFAGEGEEPDQRPSRWRSDRSSFGRCARALRKDKVTALQQPEQRLKRLKVSIYHAHAHTRMSSYTGILSRFSRCRGCTPCLSWAFLERPKATEVGFGRFSSVAVLRRTSGGQRPGYLPQRLNYRAPLGIRPRRLLPPARAGRGRDRSSYATRPSEPVRRTEPPKPPPRASQELRRPPQGPAVLRGREGPQPTNPGRVSVLYHTTRPYASPGAG